MACVSACCCLKLQGDGGRGRGPQAGWQAEGGGLARWRWCLSSPQFWARLVEKHRLNWPALSIARAAGCRFMVVEQAAASPAACTLVLRAEPSALPHGQ